MWLCTRTRAYVTRWFVLFAQGFARTPGSKPLKVFVGHEFEHDTTMSKVKDLLLGELPQRPGSTSGG